MTTNTFLSVGLSFDVIYWVALAAGFMIYSRVYHNKFFKAKSVSVAPVALVGAEPKPVPLPAAVATPPRRLPCSDPLAAELRSLLNKVCPDGFSSLSDRILAIIREAGTADASVVSLVFNSAIGAPAYLKLYAQLLSSLADEFAEVRHTVATVGHGLIGRHHEHQQNLTVICRFMGCLAALQVVKESEMQAILEELLSSVSDVKCVEAAVCAVVTMGTNGAALPLMDEAFGRLEIVKESVPLRLRFLIEDAVELRLNNFSKQHRVLNVKPAGLRAEYTRAPEDPTVHMPPSDKPFAGLQFHTEVGRRSHRFETLRVTAQHALTHGASLTVLSGTLNVDKVVEVMLSVGHSVAVIKPGMTDESRRATLQRWEKERATCLVSTHEVSPRSFTNRRKGDFLCVFDFPKSWCMYWPWIRKLGAEQAHVTTLLTTECDRRPAAVLSAWLQRTGREVPKAILAMQRIARS